jgi:hypothetical protein
MHDEKSTASRLEQLEAAIMFERGGSAQPDSALAGALLPSILAQAADQAAMPGWDERPGLRPDYTTSQPPEPTGDMSPKESWSQNSDSAPFSRILDDNHGRTAWVILGGLALALGIGFGGGLQSYPYLYTETSRKPPQPVNSSAHVSEPGNKPGAKADMLPRAQTSAAGPQTPNPPKVSGSTVSPSGRPPALGTAQPGSTSSNPIISTERANSLSRFEIPEREAVIKPVPETRPTTIAGWIVRDVRGDAIVLQGPDGVRTVMRGDTVPGVGRIDSVVRWGSRWIVATTSGLIATQ